MNQPPRPAKDTGETSSVEYLYGIYNNPADGDNEFTAVVAFPITKKTAKRIYYKRSYIEIDGKYASKGMDLPLAVRRDTRVGYVDRRTLETDGHVINRGRHGFEPDSSLYLEPPPLPVRRPPPGPDLSALRAEVADKHPDRGGDPAEFREAHRRYQRAKHQHSS